MLVGGVIEISTIDFPKRLCSVIFLSGCPFRCPYCHNYKLLNSGRKMELSDIVILLSENPLIEGVCFSGGEPLMQDIIKLCKEIKNLGLNIKIDTNGYYTDRLEKVLDYVDYVAIDVKTTTDKYDELVKCSEAAKRVVKSIEILVDSGIEFEARTTLVPTLVDRGDILEIARFLGDIGVKKYVIQQFRNDSTLDKRLRNIRPPSRDYLLEIAKEARYFVDRIVVRHTGEEITLS